MFFEPPKVKSLSRYAEYGAYPGNRYFLIALAVAITAHLAIIAIYSMVPGEEVIKIPVRVLNIKLSGGSEANGIYTMPQASTMPDTQFTMPKEQPTPGGQMKQVGDSNPETAVDKALKDKEDQKKPAVAKPHTVPPGVGKTAHTGKEAKKASHGHSPEFSLSTPKKYVREIAASKSKDKAVDGNGSGVTGEAAGKEKVSRYTQTISQWIQNHQDYARAAYKEAAEGQRSVQGQTVIRLRIDRDGHIIKNIRERTSGNELVDEIAAAMVNASDPVPAVPSDYPSDSQLEFLIAVQVDLSKH